MLWIDLLAFRTPSRPRLIQLRRFFHRISNSTDAPIAHNSYTNESQSVDVHSRMNSGPSITLIFFRTLIFLLVKLQGKHRRNTCVRSRHRIAAFFRRRWYILRHSQRTNTTHHTSYRSNVTAVHSATLKFSSPSAEVGRDCVEIGKTRTFRFWSEIDSPLFGSHFHCLTRSLSLSLSVFFIGIGFGFYFRV